LTEKERRRKEDKEGECDGKHDGDDGDGMI
jgi:hypothetical protein